MLFSTYLVYEERHLILPMRLLLSIPILVASLAAGSFLQAASRVYTVPKEPVQAVFVSSQSADLSSEAKENLAGLPEGNLGGGAPCWEAPFHWQAQDLGTLRKGSWLVKEGGAKVDISVLAFPGETGGLLANVNRWAQQIDLPPIAAESLEDCVQPYKVSGKSAQYVSLVNLKSHLSTLGVIVPAGEVFWFFKMTGDLALVHKEQEAFNHFLETVQF